LICEHLITQRKLNYQKEHYLESLPSSFGNREKDDINQITIDNLNAIG
jgi:hypothetical protein